MTTKPRPKVRRSLAAGVFVAVSALLLAGCGGGGAAPSPPAPPSSPPPPPPPPPPTTAQRSSAAQTTAQSDTNACFSIRPFYWEIGDTNTMLTSGSVQTGGGAPSVTANTAMAIASASKWLYGAYVVEKRNGVLDATDIKHLTFRSGYTSFGSCTNGQTVDECVNSGTNGVYTPSRDGFFFYDGGHMQKHASLIGLGALRNATLTAEMQSQLGSDVSFGFLQPQLAGGAFSSANGYAVFLRKLLAGTLRLGPLLGTQAVCTNSTTCPQALSAPVPADVSWHYSLGHWVEDDPASGDGAFSSAGAFGFYPWIDAGRTHYGVLARQAVEAAAGGNSARCGTLIRRAWLTATPQ